jgi:excisionase family DNA binding protein
MKQELNEEYKIQELKNDLLSSKELLPRVFEMIDDDLYYTPIDVSELLGVHPETVRRWCRQRKLRVISPIGRYKIFGMDLKQFLFRWYRDQINNNCKTS